MPIIGLAGNRACLYLDEAYNAERGEYSYRVIDFDAEHIGYNYMVNLLVVDRYPLDRMQAVQNNYLADPTDAEALAEFQAMQQHRAWSKQTAREAADYAIEQGWIKA